MNNYINLEYPYYNLIYNLDKKKIKEILKTFKPKIFNDKFGELKNKKIEKYDNKYFIIVDNWDDFYELNKLTDYFTEKVRVKCSFGNYKTPLKYWNDNKSKIINKLKNNLSIINIQEQLYKETKLCNNFKISVALTILKTFKPKRWLDISAGWGDRLLSSIFYKKIKLYCSVDPNKELHKYYKQMIDTFVPELKKNRYLLIEDSFETAQLPDIKFDLVFSSPPFFDLEKYSTFEKDSLTKYPAEKQWTEQFLYVSLMKAYNYLKVGGHMILYINTSFYINIILEKLNKLMEFKGFIHFYSNNKLRGMHVWKKINSTIVVINS